MLDDRYLLGEAPELPNLFLACGFNSIGIQSAGGVGKVLAEWIRDRRPPVELADVDARRMMPFPSNRRYLRRRVSDPLGLHHDMHMPYRPYATARAPLRGPFHERHTAPDA